jgi:CofD-related protein of GAK system
MQLRLHRSFRLPDPLKLARYAKAPELGPKVLFFSGGTALRETCPELIRYTHNSIHIITPFDSGGSSAVLRRAFAMPAVGDIRNRLMALADQSLQGHPEILSLFAHRFPAAANAHLQWELEALAEGRAELIERVPHPMRRIVQRHLKVFLSWMPEGFDLRGASVGNLVLAAGYLENDRQIDPIIYLYSKIAEVRGTVRPAANADLHLAVALRDGRSIGGQDRITGKEHPPLDSPVERIYLTNDLESLSEAETQAPESVLRLIDSADIICYPMGSFFSSLMANLLPRGIPAAIQRAECPKVFVPSTYPDPEVYGLSLEDQVDFLLRLLRRESGGEGSPRSFLDAVIVDRSARSAEDRESLRRFLDRLGIDLLATELLTPATHPRIDPQRLVSLLLSCT